MKYICGIFLLLLSVGCQATDLPAKSSSPHHTKSGFTNPYLVEPDKTFFSFLKMRFLGEDNWANHEDLAEQVPIVDIDVDALTSPNDTPQITWLGHSSFLIQYQGVNVLTDPIFSDRASPISFAGPKRYVPHMMDYEKLPPIDLVIISHNHYDHLDTKSLTKLNNWAKQNILFYLPLGLKKLLIDNGISQHKIAEFDWWDTKTHNNTRVQAMPSQHWSARGLFDRFDSLWASWSIKIGDFSFWFAGDTGYNDKQFKEIGEVSGGFDVALIPIGAYAPRWFMQYYHVNPDEALNIHRDVKAKKSLGMHWGTFPLTAEEPGAPVIALEKALKAQKMRSDVFTTLAIGQTITIDR